MSQLPRPEGVPGKRLVSWLTGSIALGWFVVYNVLRIARGDSPRSAALVSLGIGIIVGLVLFGAFVSIYGWMARHDWVHPPADGAEPLRTPADPRARRTVRLTAIACGLLAVVAIAVGVVLLGEWLTAASGQRSTPKLVIGAWDLLVGLWLAYEPIALGRDDTADVDAVGLAGLITAVLGGVALARDMFTAGQVVLIVAAGVTSAIAQFAFWRLGGSKGKTLAPFLALAVAALAMILPLMA